MPPRRNAIIAPCKISTIFAFCLSLICAAGHLSNSRRDHHNNRSHPHRTSTTITTTTTNTTTTVCMCPAGTSGIIFFTADPSIIEFNMPPASATCGGCSAGLTHNCYQTQSDSNPTNDFAEITAQCSDYANFCACPSNGTPCFTFGQNNAVFDVQIFSFCDAAGVCLSYLMIFSSDGSDFITNGQQSFSFNQQFDGSGNLQQFSPTSPYMKSRTVAVSCNGCGPISTAGTMAGTGVNCTGPLITLNG